VNLNTISRLEPCPVAATVAGMKFVAALFVVLVISFVLCAGIWAAAHGHGIWFLALGVIGFLALFIRYGCQTH
jgi:hypothetical protein